MEMKRLAGALVSACLLLAATLAAAQPPGWGPPGGGMFGSPFGGSPGGPPGFGGGDQSPASRLTGFLQTMDANRNGILEPDEVPAERRGMMQFFASRAGVDASQPISISKVAEALASRMGSFGSRGSGDGDRRDEDRRDRDGRDDRDRGRGRGDDDDRRSRSRDDDDRDRNRDDNNNATESLVPGFGNEHQVAQVPDFSGLVAGVGGAYTRLAAGPSVQVDSRVREYAETNFRRYDRNQSGVLEKDEWEGMRGDPKETDRNRDGRITKDEYTARVAEYMKSRSSDRSDGRGDRDRSGSPAAEPKPDQTADEEVARKSYRFLSPLERLPDGLPGWFAERDRDADGQVAMAEFTASWSEQKVSEFLSFDANSDGVITAHESLNPGTGGTSAPSGASASSAAPAAPAKSGGGTPWWMR
jgi:hypothetical protein